MAVYHVLKDGYTTTDITGHVVREDDAKELYRFIHSVAKKKAVAIKARERCEKEA